jgi:hypothetical protein
MSSFAISTLIPCMNSSVDLDSRETTVHSLTKFTVHAEFVSRDPVLDIDIAIEPVRLLDEDHAAGRICLQTKAHIWRSDCVLPGVSMSTNSRGTVRWRSDLMHDAVEGDVDRGT